MNVDRLNRLATLLRTQAAAPPAKRLVERFDLDQWFERGAPGCGTTACAVGTAMLDPQFRKEGLGASDTFNRRYPVFDGEEHWKAVRKFFDLSLVEALWLFYYGAYPEKDRVGTKGELAVADRIDCLIATKAKSIPEDFKEDPNITAMIEYLL